MAVLIVLAFAISLFLNSYQDIYHFPALAFLCAALLLGICRKQWRIPSSPVSTCILLLWALSALTFALSSVPFSSQIAFCIFSSLPLTFFSLPLSPSCAAEKGEEGRSSILIFSLPLFTLLALSAIIQHFFIPGPYGARAAGPMLDPNCFATILNIGLIVTTGLAIGAAHRQSRIILVSIALLLFAALVATESRSGLLAAMIALGVLLGLTRWKLTPIRAAFAAVVFAPAACGLLFFTGNPVSLTDRLSLWRSSWRMLLDHPWIGAGPGTFAFYYPAYREPLLDQSLGFFSHLDPLQMGVEMGIAAPILFYALLAAVLIRTIQALKAGPADILRLRILVPFTALLAVALQAHVNYPLYMMPILIACGVLLAFWHRATVDVLGQGEITVFLTSKVSRSSAFACAAFVCVILMLLSGRAAGGNYFLRQSQAAKDPQTALQTLAWAEGIGPESFIAPEVDMARTNLHLIDRTGSIKSAHLKKGLLDETDRLLTAAAAWNPAWAEIDYLRGEAAGIKGQKTIMLEAWFTALTKNPMHFPARRDLAIALRDDHRPDDAIRIVKDGLNYPHPLSYRDWAVPFLKDIP